MSFSLSSYCTKCRRNQSTTSCEGCQGKFCSKCIHDHHDELARELDVLVNTRNELFEIISNPSINVNSCLQEIDQWQKEMHVQLDRVANKAREYIQQSLIESNKNLRTELDGISQELQSRQKTGGYVEPDLSRIRQQLEYLNNKAQRLHEKIRIDTSNSKNFNWNSLLRIEPIPGSPKNSKPAFVQKSQPYDNSLYPTSNSRTAMSHQQHYSNKRPASKPYSSPDPSQSSRSLSLDMGHQFRTYTCVGCKTINNYNPNGPNNCITCRSPAPFFH